MSLILFFILNSFCQPNVDRLQLTGSGIREKKVLLFNVDVYKLESYATEKKSIESSKEKALKMTMLRDVKANDIVKSFSERLEKNSINAQDPSIQKIFQAIPTEVKKGDVIHFAGEKLNKVEEQLTVEFPNKVTVTVKGPGLVNQFWKIWFGKTEDDAGLNRLKEQLLNKS